MSTTPVFGIVRKGEENLPIGKGGVRICAPLDDGYKQRGHARRGIDALKREDARYDRSHEYRVVVLLNGKWIDA